MRVIDHLPPQPIGLAGRWLSFLAGTSRLILYAHIASGKQN